MIARSARRGMLLVVVLVIIAVLAVLGATFSFHMNADLAGVVAVNDQQQARLAAESGIQRVILLLRKYRTDVDKWWNNPEDFRRILVWAPDQIGASTSVADQEAIEGRPAWRFSIVATYWESDTDTAKIRYGITDEAAKINLNTASREQLLSLFDQTELEKSNVTAEQLTDALIDWRDEDDEPVSDYGAESSYYITLEPPYRAKNRPLETVEEMLMIKGFNGRILWGEDFNRNGYLDANEDDGPEGFFPPDDGDSVLDRGIFPFVTIFSWDFNSGNDNRARLDLNQVPFRSFKEGGEGGAEGEGGTQISGLPDYLLEGLDIEVIKFIGEAQRRGFKFRSAGELLGLEVYEDGSSNYDKAWKKYWKNREKAENSRKQLEKSSEEETQEGPDEDLQLNGEDELRPDDQGEDAVPAPRRGEREGSRVGRDRADDDGAAGRGGEEGDAETRGSDGKRDDPRRQQSIRDGRGGGRAEPQEVDQPPEQGDSRSGERRPGSRAGRGEPRRPGREGTNRDAGGGGSGKGKGTPVASPVTPEAMPAIMDRLTAMGMLTVPGLINVNTAPLEVLKTVPGLSEENVAAILATRSQLSAADKETTAWLVANNVLDPETFALVSNDLTTRSIQFTIDSIGFADHVGTCKRLQVVVEMRGHLAQIRYYRDISLLGMGYPIRDDQRSEGFAFEDQ